MKEAMEAAKSNAPPAAVTEMTAVTQPQATTQQPWSLAQPFTLMRSSSGQAYMNVSFVADLVTGASTEPDAEALFGAHHDPHQRGFNLTAAEMTLDGAVDPYFKGQATMTLVLEPSGETVTELDVEMLPSPFWTVCRPVVLNVTWKFAAPTAAAKSAGVTACPSLLVTCTIAA